MVHEVQSRFENPFSLTHSLTLSSSLFPPSSLPPSALFLPLLLPLPLPLPLPLSLPLFSLSLRVPLPLSLLSGVGEDDSRSGCRSSCLPDLAAFSRSPSRTTRKAILPSCHIRSEPSFPRSHALSLSLSLSLLSVHSSLCYSNHQSDRLSLSLSLSPSSFHSSLSFIPTCRLFQPSTCPSRVLSSLWFSSPLSLANSFTFSLTCPVCLSVCLSFQSMSRFHLTSL